MKCPHMVWYDSSVKGADGKHKDLYELVNDIEKIISFKSSLIWPLDSFEVRQLLTSIRQQKVGGVLGLNTTPKAMQFHVCSFEWNKLS